IQDTTMDRFQAMQVFVRVVDANSFTRAADSLALPRTTVTTAIQNLERRLGVRLLNRTTRRISLTPDGAAYYEHCTRILAEVEETEACFQEAALRPKGKLRIDVPASIEIGRAHLNSSHVKISYAVFCLKKKKNPVHADPKTVVS